MGEEKRDDDAGNGDTMQGDNSRRGSSSEPSTINKWYQYLRSHLLSLVVNSKEGDQGEEQGLRRRKRVMTALTLLLLWYYHRRRRQKLPLLPSVLTLWKSLRHSQQNGYRQAADAPLSLLVQAAKLGNVSRALIMGSDSAIAYKVDGTWRKSLLPPNNPSLQSNLLELLSEGGCTDVSALPDSIWARMATPAIAAVPFVYLALVWRMMRNLHGKDDAARTYQDEASWQRTTFAHVAGLDDVVTEVSEVVSYLSNPTLYHNLGARPPRGVLLYGPPGGGKTLLARAVAGEAHCDTFVACSGSDFVDTYVGRGASRVRELFDRARRHARGRWPRQRRTMSSAVIFIDEIDALAKSRSSGSLLSNNDERDQTLNQLLAEMDGFAVHDDVTMIVIAATNRADVLDPAILRRFDRQVHVGYPDAKGREAILKVHARRIHCNINQVDWKYLASSTGDFSGADLRNVINEAALMAVRDKHPVVEQRHLERAVGRVQTMKANIGRTSKPVFAMTARGLLD